MRNSENGKILKTKSPSKEKGAGSEKLEMRREAREKLPPFPEPKPGEDISTGQLTEESLETEATDEGIESADLEEICGTIWVCLYQIGGLIRKDFEPLTDGVRKLLEPPSARLAKKYHVEKMMNDEIMLAGILGVDVTKRLLKKPKAKPKEEVKKK